MKELAIEKIDIDSQVDMLITTYDSVFVGKVGNYVSTPITTGKRLLDVLLENNVRDRDELKAKLGSDVAQKMLRNVMEENSRAGEELATSLRNRGLTNVINPARFRAIHFEQDHYNQFWVTLIEKKICSVYFNQNWEYSQGCTTEYLATARHNVPAYDHLGAPLSASMAIAKMGEALKYLADHGFPETTYSLLGSNLSQLQEASKK